MSKPLSPTEQAALEQLRAELGGEFGGITRTPDGDAVAELVLRFRGLILEAAQEDGVGVRELARRLGVSASAVSRHLRSDGDIRASTAAIFAHALGRKWFLALRPADEPAHPTTNYKIINPHQTSISAPQNRPVVRSSVVARSS